MVVGAAAGAARAEGTQIKAVDSVADEIRLGGSAGASLAGRTVAVAVARGGRGIDVAQANIRQTSCRDSSLSWASVAYTHRSFETGTATISLYVGGSQMRGG